MQIGADNTAVIAANGGFAALASSFVMNSIVSIIPWLFVMTAIICCDLFAAWWRCYRTSETIRFSKAIRDTMAKIVIYYAFVVSACFTEVASAMPDISKNACLLICAIEFVSILGNILKTHGINISLNDVLKLFLSKRLDIAKEELESVIVKEDDKVGNNQ